VASICFYTLAALANAFLGSRAVTLLTPNNADDISMAVRGNFSSAGHTTLGVPTVVVAGSDISINILTSGCPNSCAQVFTPFSVSTGIGVISAGTYNDTISIFEDRVFTDTLPRPFTVAPEPSTALLLASGLSCLALRRRRPSGHPIRLRDRRAPAQHGEAS
jgi:hypothetical protein